MQYTPFNVDVTALLLVLRFFGFLEPQTTLEDSSSLDSIFLQLVQRAEYWVNEMGLNNV